VLWTIHERAAIAAAAELLGGRPMTIQSLLCTFEGAGTRFLPGDGLSYVAHVVTRNLRGETHDSERNTGHAAEVRLVVCIRGSNQSGGMRRSWTGLQEKRPKTTPRDDENGSTSLVDEVWVRAG